jgi:hypothetical protein
MKTSGPDMKDLFLKLEICNYSAGIHLPSPSGRGRAGVRVKNNNMKELFEEVLSLPEFVNEPPVLFDIGASYGVVKEWADIAKYCKCVAFDADAREFGYINNEKSIFKELFVYNCIITDKVDGSMDFYLTRSPGCSSLLEPDTEGLSEWEFNELFCIDKKVSLKTRSINSVLKELDIKKVDWFKSDSQGTDLRLFSCMGDEACSKTIIAEFEPGILDAYKGEDKLYSVIGFMLNRPFWVCDLDLFGDRRFNKDIIKKYGMEDHRYKIRTSPGWGNVSFINTFKSSSTNNSRDYLFGWIVATIKLQHGFALELADAAYDKFGQEIFRKLIDHSKNEIIKLPKPVIKYVKQPFSRRFRNSLNRYTFNLPYKIKSMLNGKK